MKCKVIDSKMSYSGHENVDAESIVVHRGKRVMGIKRELKEARKGFVTAWRMDPNRDTFTSC